MVNDFIEIAMKEMFDFRYFSCLNWFLMNTYFVIKLSFKVLNS
jgi:hypothetical protein